MSESLYLSLAEAARQCPGKPAPSTVWRWCRRGVRARSGERVRLSHVRVGGRIYTTLHSLTRFFEATAQADIEHFDRPKQYTTKGACSESQRLRDIKRADSQCKDAGF
ncbi:MAG: DUF1580 domain-containing protein [Planctomycetes bacterium]|nr:DUF1580 domain-containing protein [Planctomycetota bacterium]